MKHVGKMKNNSARVVVLYRTIPGEPQNCLVVGTQGLIDSQHDSLMSLVESSSGQEANELADILSVRKFPDGSNMLQFLHVHGHIRKVPTSAVLMTPSAQTQLPLNDLNELIAKQKGVKVEDLAIKDESKKGALNEPEVVKPSVETIETTTFSLTPAEMRARAEQLLKEAAKLKKDADALDPPKSKKKSKLEVE